MLVVAIIVLCIVEFGFQLRAQTRTGESVFSAMLGRTTYIKHPQLDVRVLRPSSVISGTEQTIRTNRYGLRGDDFAPNPPENEWRIALLGASTIMGAYAPTNDQTSSAALERLLNATSGDHKVRVVNAGLGGATLRAQSQLLIGLLPGLGIQQVIWYPGTNDIGCFVPASSKDSESIRLPWPAVPKWTLTPDIVVKNTAYLRSNSVASSQTLRPDFDPQAFRALIKRGILTARQLGISIVLVTSATSFRSDMPPALISRRASSALFFRPCLSGPELSATVDSLNGVLREAALEHDVPLIDAARLLPPDPALFGDASHFSLAGENAFAVVLAAQLASQRLLAGASP